MKQRAARRVDALSRTPAAMAVAEVLVVVMGHVNWSPLLQAPRSARTGAPT